MAIAILDFHFSFWNPSLILMKEFIGFMGATLQILPLFDANCLHPVFATFYSCKKYVQILQNVSFTSILTKAHNF